jgi:hypothetical protein
MISCYLTGGLGNQLFQICTTLAYCIQHKCSFLFPYKKTYAKETNRPEYWDNFLVALKSHTTLNSSVSVDDLLAWKRYAEPHHTYDEIPVLEQNTILKGFFQSYKYFDLYINQITEIIGLDVLRNEVLKQYPIFYPETEHTISIHFRLGDYKKLQCYHPIMPWGYYKTAIEHIVNTKKLYRSHKRIVVYCFYEAEDDDIVSEYINKLKQNISHTIDYRKVNYITDDWKQMLVMSVCDDNVIANSTFSWWGAYFNPSPDKIVCYPDAWYGHQLYYIQTTDMFPSSWSKMYIDRSLYPIPCNCNK